MSLRSALLTLAAAAMLAGCPSPPDTTAGGGPAKGAKAGKGTPKAGGGAPAQTGDPKAGGPPPADGAGGPPPADGAGAPPAPGTPPTAQGDAPVGQNGGPPPAPEDALGGFVPTSRDLPNFSKGLKDGDATVTLSFEIKGATRGQVDISVADAKEPQVLHIEMFSDTSTVTITAPASSSQSLQASAMAFDESGKMVGMSEPVPVKLAGEDASFSLTIKEGAALEAPPE